MKIAGTLVALAVLSLAYLAGLLVGENLTPIWVPYIMMFGAGAAAGFLAK